MKSTLFITLCVLFSANLFAQGRSQTLSNIRDLSYQIEQETYSTRSDSRTLTNVQALLAQALNELQNGGGSGRFQECRSYAFPILDRTLPSADAMDKAVKMCRNVFAIEEMKYLFGVYNRTQPSEAAITRAARFSSQLMVGKLELLQFAVEKYDRTLPSASAADRAVQLLEPAQVNRNPGGTLSCFQKTYPAYDRTLPSAEAMDRTIAACTYPNNP